MLYKKYLDDKLIEILSHDNIEFYHTVRYLIKDDINDVKFERSKSAFGKNNRYTNDVFIEGFSLIKKFYGVEFSLIESVFNNLKNKYSFHIDIHSSSSPNSEKLNIDFKDRNIYITGNFFPLAYTLTSNIRNYEGDTLDVLFAQYWSRELNYENYNSYNFASINKKILDEIKGKFDEDLIKPISNIIELLIIFLYPTSTNPIKKYSIYVITSYENRHGEITNGGLVTIFKPDTTETELSYLRNKLSYVTALWANYESTESLIKIIKDSYLRSAITTILVDSFAHNVAAHALTALEWWFKQRADLIDSNYWEYWKEEMIEKIEKGNVTNFRREYTLWLDAKRAAALEEKDRLYLIQYIQHLTDRAKIGTEPLPISLNHVLYPLLRFLRDKAVFWSGVTRDYAFGGEIHTWFNILYNEFANNPLFLGTIAYSEKITKIRIFLKVMDSEEKTVYFEASNTLAHQEFVTLDLSHSGIRDTGVEKESHYFTSDITQYNFVYQSQYFQQWKTLLNKSEYKVFIPNGKVGIHAFLTLIENTLRNVKHFKNEVTLQEMRKDGINLLISITPTQLNPDAPVTTDFPLFRVGVRLNHTTEFTSIEEKDLDEYLFCNALETIVKDSGEARLGGNSQDKICASMLLNNRFSEVESLSTNRALYYYPWIYFSMTDIESNTEGIKKGKFSFRPNWQFRRAQNGLNLKKVQEEIEREYLQQRKEVKHTLNKKGIDIGTGAIVKYFYLWKGETVKEGEMSEDDSPSRFKFVRKNDNNPTNEILRFVETDSNEISTLYIDWLSQWISNLKITFYDYKENLFGYCLFAPLKESEWKYPNQADRKKAKNILPSKNEIKIYLSHASDETPKTTHYLYYRSHGKLVSQFFGGDKELLRFNAHYIYDFIETLGTKIFISDKRVDDRIKNKKMYQKMLNLHIISEIDTDWNVAKRDLISRDNRSGKLVANCHICILHLSFIEGLNYKEHEIPRFLKDELGIGEGDVPDNFYFVITSGRGRSEWMSNIIHNPTYRFVTFKPIESILEAIENGISIKDDFEVKYNLVKLFLK